MNKHFSLPEILGVSAVIPKRKLSLKNLDFEKNLVDRIIKLTGIEEVRLADDDKTTADYCIDAAQNLFTEMNIDKDEIDGLVFVTTTSDYIMPPTSMFIQDKLGLKKNCIAFDINYGCSGYVYGLFQAFMMIETGYCEKVLVCVGDTTGGRYVNPKDKSLRMVIGDAAAATLVGKSTKNKLSTFSFCTEGRSAKYLMIPAGGHRQPKIPGVTDKEYCDVDGNIRTQENMYMNGLEVMRFAMSEVKDVIQDVLETMRWEKEEVDMFALHQANVFMVKSLIRQMKLNLDKVPICVSKTGNTGQASIPLMLCNLYSGHRVQKMEKSILCGFGVGLTCAAGAINLEGTYFCPVKEF